MQRRALLATGSSALVAAVAGCTALGDERDLGRESETVEAGRTDLVYTHGGERLLVVSVRDRLPIGGDLTTVRVVLEQRTNTYLDDVSLGLHPDLAPNTPLEYYLRVPGESAFETVEAVRRNDVFDLELSDDADDRGVTKVVDVGLSVEPDDLRGQLGFALDVTLAEAGLTGSTYSVTDTSRLEFRP